MAKNKDMKKPKSSQSNFAGGNGNPSPSVNASQKSLGANQNPNTPQAK